MIGEKLLKSLDVGVVNLESVLKEVSKRITKKGSSNHRGSLGFRKRKERCLL